MMTFFGCIGSNAVLAACLALFAWGVTRVWRNPHLAYALWLLVLMKLVTPPLIHISVGRLLVTNQTGTAPSELAVDHVRASSLPSMGAPLIAPEFDSMPPGSGNAASPYSVSGICDSIMLGWPQWLFAVWVVGIAVFAAVALRRHLRLRPLMAGSQPADATLANHAHQLAEHMGLTTCPPVLVTTARIGPFVTPGIRPAIVLPCHLLAELTRSQVESILAHELAHIRRGDHLARTFEIIVLLLNWWNPIAWYACQAFSEAQEQCCDAWVVWARPDCRREYGRTLAHTAELTQVAKPTTGAVPALFGNYQLSRRIDMILNRIVNPKASRPLSSFAFLVGLLVLPVSLVSQEPAISTGEKDEILRVIAERSVANRRAFSFLTCEFAVRRGYADSEDEARKSGPKTIIEEATGLWCVDSGQCRFEMQTDVAKWDAAIKQWLESNAPAGANLVRVPVGTKFPPAKLLWDGERGLTVSGLLHGGGLIPEGRSGPGVQISPFDMAGWMGRDEEKHPARLMEQGKVDGRIECRLDGRKSLDGESLLSVTFSYPSSPELGEITYLFDLQHGFLPVQMQRTKPSVSVFVTDIRECSGGRWFPMRTVSVERSEHGSFEVLEVLVRRLDVDTRPDESMLAIDLAEGTQLHDSVDASSAVRSTDRRRVSVKDLRSIKSLMSTPVENRFEKDNRHGAESQPASEERLRK